MTEKSEPSVTEKDREKENDRVNEKEPIEQIQQIVDMGSTTVKNSRGAVHCLTIVGQVEGHQSLAQGVKATRYEHVLPLLAAIEESEEVEGLLLLLNTMGGDIEAGLAIAEMIAGMETPTVSVVLGGGHSIGIPLAVCTKRSFIVPSASMTVHPVRTGGTTIIAPQTFRYFERLQERIVRFVSKNANITAERFRELMLSAKDMAADVGSVLYGEEAVEEGLVDEIGSLSDALDALYEMIALDRKREEERRRDWQ